MFWSCEKDVTVNLPQGIEKIVVEGHIEQNQPPYVILTKSVAYFAPADINSFTNLFVHDAVIVVSDGTLSDTLVEYCANELDSLMLTIVAEYLGIPSNDLSASNYCIYTVNIMDLIFGKPMLGEIGKGYRLTIYADGDTLTSYTTIPYPVHLDSVWFGVQKGYEPDGWAWAKLSDPDTIGNAYRWFAKLYGEQTFTAPDGSAFNDQFFNGQKLDFFYDKGQSEFSDSAHSGISHHMYQPGDTIIIKFCSIDLPHYFFIRSFETAMFSNSNPFATPTPVKTNIKGGLGVWGGYGVTLDTIFGK